MRRQPDLMRVHPPYPVKALSTAAQMRCPRKICTSWIRAVTSDGTIRQWSARCSAAIHATLATGEAGRGEGIGPRDPQRFHHVRRTARGRDPDEQVARTAERLHLPGKHLVEAEVVRGSRENG